MNRGPHAYTLIETLIAGALLLIGICAAAVLANTMVLQEEANARITRYINLQEQVSRLYQLGLDYAAITNIIPEKCSSSNPPPAGSIYLSITSASTNIAGIGTVEQAACRMVYPVGQDTGGTAIYGTNDITSIRPSIR